ncbi:MAG: diadenosine tetraphosphatase [Gammaproteobacteria bacterium CG_4_10_14_0_8_um_filter_38_16]|nr:MAG: diadenosine tetraphosphatase [Gammaproteobacteria bacterium CG_4_10_14_0_8_um_filter_38_16]PJA04132.1 MAG: diadenosine tetraphosphatase [Gammaproteobacteria bacterium CG_4_10_14_0_2_um_filter_38_22]PJB10001.1 MAG: diadenosine tetraphosphatase [Gammaproteobacteria bacterium CG_4_9_14_3_um_filter_38_9]
MYTVDKKIERTSFKVLDWELSEIRLKNNQYYPWFILMPRVSKSITEIFELTQQDQKTLFSEMTRLSSLIKTHFHAEKINVGMLGNIVSQLHIHVVARFKDDLSWPHSVWQANVAEKLYSSEEIDHLIKQLRVLLS